MKYNIVIEGGFANIPKTYAGYLDLGEAEKAILELLKKEPGLGNEQLRDMLVYRITLGEGDNITEGIFDDGNIPDELRSLIDKIKGQGVP